MTVIGSSVVVLGSLYLGISLFRIYQYATSHGLQVDTSNARLTIVGFSTGIVYIIGNQEIQPILQSYLNSGLPIPVMPLIWMFFAVIMVCYLYLSNLRKFTVFLVDAWIIRLQIIAMLTGIVITLLYHNHLSYFQLQLVITLLTSLSSIVAALYIQPMLLVVLKEEKKSVQQAQFRCFMLTTYALFAATVLLAVDSLYKLWFSINVVYTQTYILSVLLHSVSVIALHIVNEGNLTSLAEYPAKIRAYIRLTKLYNAIQNKVQFPDAYSIPLPKRPAPDQIDLLNYRLVIQISDRYLWLDDTNIKRRIAEIIQRDVPGSQIIFELAEIKM